MIEAKVVFDGYSILVGEFAVGVDFGEVEFNVFSKDDKWIGRFSTLEQAIAWCLEN